MSKILWVNKFIEVILIDLMGLNKIIVKSFVWVIMSFFFFSIEMCAFVIVKVKIRFSEFRSL